MSNKFLLTPESGSATNPLQEDLDADGNSIVGATNYCLLSTSGNQLCLDVEDGLTPGYTISLPNAPGVSGQILELTADNQTLEWLNIPSGSGDVDGPASATDEAICRFDTGTGKLIQNSTVLLGDTGIMSNVLEIQNTTGNLDLNTSGTFGIEQTGAGIMDIKHTGASGNFEIQNDNGTLELQSASTDAFAINLQSTVGGIRLQSTKPTILLSTSNDNINDIWLDAQGANSKILNQSHEIRFLGTGTDTDSFLVDYATGGMDINLGLNMTIDSTTFDVNTSGDTTIDSDDIILTSNSANAFSIDLVAPNGGIRATSDFPILLSHTGGVSPNGIDLNCTGIGEISMGASAITHTYTQASLDAYRLSCTTGGADIDVKTDYNVDAEGDIILTSTNANFVNAVDLQAPNGKVRIDGGRVLIDASVVANDSIDINSAGGIDIDSVNDIVISASSGDIDLDATDVLINSDGNSNPNSIELTCLGANAGIKLTTTGSGFIDANGTDISTAGGITVADAEGIAITNDGVSFGDGSFATSLLNPASPTQNISIRLPNNTPMQYDFLRVESEVAGLITTSFGGLPNYLYGFKQIWLGVNSMQFGTTGITSCAISTDFSYMFMLVGTATTSFTDLTTDQSETADTSYEIYRVGDTGGVASDDFLWVSEGTDIETVSEFTGGTYDVYRKVGWIRNDDSSDILEHTCEGIGHDRFYLYWCDKAQTLIVASGSATTFTNIDFSDFVDPTADVIKIRAAFGSDAGSSTNNNDELVFRPDGSTIASSASLYTISPGQSMSAGVFFDNQLQVPCSSAKIVEYLVSDAGDNDAYIYCSGFHFNLL